MFLNALGGRHRVRIQFVYVCIPALPSGRSKIKKRIVTEDLCTLFGQSFQWDEQKIRSEKDLRIQPECSFCCGSLQQARFTRVHASASFSAERTSICPALRQPESVPRHLPGRFDIFLFDPVYHFGRDPRPYIWPGCPWACNAAFQAFQAEGRQPHSIVRIVLE